MLTTWFANPPLLWTLMAVPICMALLLYARWRRRQSLCQLGTSSHRTLVVNYRRRHLKNAFVLLGLALLAIACAGPQWGIDPNAQTRRGRDLFVLLDLSRSMDAEQPSRIDLALRSLDDLADELERNGGHRVALAGFAAKPRLFFPFTHDTDHLRHVLKQIADRDYPSLNVPEPVSGTRIGAAIKLAVESCTQARGPKPIIVLISDGDDPVADDEWKVGVELARAKNVVVHVVGVGDAVKGDIIPHGLDPLLFDDQPIVSKLNEALLRAIADQTGGTYLPARTASLPLGTILLRLLANDRRDTAAIDSSIKIYEQQYAWFLLPAIAIFVLASTLGDGRAVAPKSTPAQPSQERTSTGVGVLIATLLALLSISAAHPVEIDDLIRQGNAAFEQGDFADAIKLYEKAEGRTRDPGLVAFNKAVSLYRLGRHREAIVCFRQSLDDAEAPPTRRAHAWFDLGNALLNAADGRADELADAVKAYHACLAQPNLSDVLRSGARHNLEIAQLRWLAAKAKQVDPTKEKNPPNAPKDPPNEPKNGDGKKEQYVPVEPDPQKKSDENVVMKAGKPSDKLRAGSARVLPDEDAVRPLTAADTERTLDDLARRIAAARRNLHHPLGPARLTTKDW